MKEQKKSTSKVIVRSALILLLLTLISGCFLGSTFARYVSKGEGDLSAGVAEWKITETVSVGEGEATVGLGKFSPNMAAYQSGQTRTRYLNDVELFSITNEGDVDANLYLSFNGTAVAPATDSNIAMTLTAYGYTSGGDTVDTNNKITFETTYSTPAASDTYKPTSTEFADIFTIVATVTTTGGVDESKSGYYVLPTGSSITVTVDITWTTDLDGDSSKTIQDEDKFPDGANVVYADLRDTWIGENVAAVGFSYSWYALQGSELPASGATNTPNP